ncbi:MAG: hypothetical protein NTY64_14850 [Deltaproteobacteria bacterium]|nr:hypothetical protein [Deltaproteobacteria bacterium]
MNQRLRKGNATRINFHTAIGSEDIGIMKAVARKPGKFFDPGLMQKIYPLGS